MAVSKSSRPDHEARKRGVPSGCVSIVASNVFQTPLDYGAAISALATFDLETALTSLAMLNAATSALLETPRLQTATDALRITGLLRFLFDSSHFQAAENIARSQIGQLFVPVSPQGCAAMTEACLRHCARRGGLDVSQPNTTPAFAHILLSFQEFLLPPGLFSKEIDFAHLEERQFALLACNYLGANHVHAIGSRPTRFYVMFEHEHPQSEMLRRTGKNARAWFDQILDLDPLFFRVLALAMFGTSLAFNIDRPDIRSLTVDIPHSLAQLKPPVASIFGEILRHSVVNLAEVDQLPAVTTWEEALYRFNYLRRRPLWILPNGRHLILHRSFLVEKFWEGVLHVLTEAVEARAPREWASSARRRTEQVRSDFGYIFDDYCRTVLRTLFAGPGTIFEFGFEITGGLERDGLVALPGCVLLFEFVQHPISVAERGTGEMSRFLAHLHDNIRKLASVRDEILAGRLVAGRVFPTQQIIPIVVTSDTFPISHLNAEAFARGLEQAVGPDAVCARDRALPVQTLGIEQLEHLGRTRPAEDGAAGIAGFLSQRAADVLERFTASPTCGLVGGKANLWESFDEEAERSMMVYGALVFRPETLPPDWHRGWGRFKERTDAPPNLAERRIDEEKPP